MLNIYNHLVIFERHTDNNLDTDNLFLFFKEMYYGFHLSFACLNPFYFSTLACLLPKFDSNYVQSKYSHRKCC